VVEVAERHSAPASVAVAVLVDYVQLLQQQEAADHLKQLLP
jgi:hypothetical protein